MACDGTQNLTENTKLDTDVFKLEQKWPTPRWNEMQENHSNFTFDLSFPSRPSYFTRKDMSNANE